VAGQTLKKLMAYGNLVCPFCTIGRKFPNSFIGKKVRRHWAGLPLLSAKGDSNEIATGSGCPFHQAYVEVFGKKK